MEHKSSPEELDELMQVTSPRAWIALVGCALLVLGALVWSVVGTVTDTVDGQGVLLRDKGVQVIATPCDGQVTKFEAQSGVPIEKATPLVEIKGADGKLHTVTSKFRCQILSRRAREGDSVSVKQGPPGTPLLLVEDLTLPLEARLYISVNAGYAIKAGSRVQLSPANVTTSEYGYLKGIVTSAGKFPVTEQDLVDRLQHPELSTQLLAGGPKLQIVVALVAGSKAASVDSQGTDGTNKASGEKNARANGTGAEKKVNAPVKAALADNQPAGSYQWSVSNGPSLPLYSGTPCQGRIVMARYAPICLVFPSLATYFPSLKRN